MEWLVLLLLVNFNNAKQVVISHNNEMQVVISPKLILEPPELVSVTGIEPNGAEVIWRSIADSEADPVMGYKILMWPLELEKRSRYELVNGGTEPGLTSLRVSRQPFGADNIPKVTPLVFYQFEGTSLIINQTEKNTLYEIRVQAFKEYEDGPYSLPTRFMLVDELEFDAVFQRLKTNECLMSLSSNLMAQGENYDFVYNIYV